MKVIGTQATKETAAPTNNPIMKQVIAALKKDGFMKSKDKYLKGDVYVEWEYKVELTETKKGVLLTGFDPSGKKLLARIVPATAKDAKTLTSDFLSDYKSLHYHSTEGGKSKAPGKKSTAKQPKASSTKPKVPAHLDPKSPGNKARAKSEAQLKNINAAMKKLKAQKGVQNYIKLVKMQLRLKSKLS